MANIISLNMVAKEYAGKQLFRDLSFGIESDDRIGLIGPNGAGKSTLIKILANQTDVDSGKVARKSGLKVGFLFQVPEFKKDDTLLGTVSESLDPNMDDWEKQMKALEFLSLLNLEDENYTPETEVSTLSGGWKKKIALIRELAKEPDLLLLDEPTNHLDVESILWLEQVLNKATFAFIVITHDRAFLQNVTKRILELDPRNKGGLLSVAGSYVDYLDIKQAQLSSQASQEDNLKNKLRRETEWLRRGPNARSTKQQARIDRAYDLGDEVAEISERNRDRKVNLDFKAMEGGPKKLIEAVKISKSYNGKAIFTDFSLLIAKNTCVGLLGRNGAGKSTLIKVLCGEVKPDSGEVKFADNLKIAYFEQNRESLNQNITLRQAICPAGDYVNLRGQYIHIKSYLERFLFKPDQSDSPLRKLSGGEQSRVLIAQLMLKEANLLVLDEPTNDLDVATLDLLQDQLESFEGAIILVSHDRFFLDQVCTNVLALEHGQFSEFYGLQQWEEARKSKDKAPAMPAKSNATVGEAKVPPKDAHKRRLSYNEQRELDGMEKMIEEKEKELAALLEKSEQRTQNLGEKQKLYLKISEHQKLIEELYKRWSDLEAQKA